MKLSNNPYEDLANAIVIQATKDYRASLKRLKSCEDYPPALRMKADIERFYRSNWFAILTEVNGEYIIRRLNAEVAA